MTDVVFGIAVACAVVFSVIVMLLVVVQMPSSSPPSEGRALAFAFVFWLVGLASLVAAPIFGDRGAAAGLWVWLGCALTVVVFASATGAAFESAILDGCEFGTGSGDQSFCLPRADSLPSVRIAWWVVGGAESVAAGMLARLARRWKAEYGETV